MRTSLHMLGNEFKLRKRVDADKVRLHLLTCLVGGVPIQVICVQPIATRLEVLPAHVTLVPPIVCPRVYLYPRQKKKGSDLNHLKV